MACGRWLRQQGNEAICGKSGNEALFAGANLVILAISDSRRACCCCYKVRQSRVYSKTAFYRYLDIPFLYGIPVNSQEQLILLWAYVQI